jgi:hypothetical protein
VLKKWGGPRKGLADYKEECEPDEAYAPRARRWGCGAGFFNTLPIQRGRTRWSSERQECSDATPDGTVVARAGSLELSVDEIVALLVDAEDLPINADVVEAVAQLWVDYTLLARAAAEDSTLSQLDFTPMVQAALDQELLMALGDSAIQLDTLVTDADVAARYEGAGADVQYRARHIMLRYPLQATAAQRDSVRDRLAELRTQDRGRRGIRGSRA